MKRRRVFRALLGYGIVSFAILQVVEPVMHGLNLPEWVLKATVVGLGLGFPLTLVLAWVFDVRAGRIESTAPSPQPRMLLLLVALGIALGAPGVGWYLWKSHRAAPGPAAEASPSIAVLPFTDLSPAKDQDWMCDGIAEEILDALCTVTGLRVAARSSSFQFKGKFADAHEMARALGVSTLLEGSVRKIGDRLRVSARLVSGEGYELWSNSFDRGVSDAFAIQEEIARAVVGALRLRMQPRDQARRGTTNAQAYEMYLRGRQSLSTRGTQSLELGRQMFKRAIALDPAFAEAHAGLADTDAFQLQWLLTARSEQAERRAEALAESEEALRLAPDLAEAHVARGNLLSLLQRPAEADESFRRATALAPGLNEAWYYYGRFLFSAQRYAEAAQAFEQAAAVDPDDYGSLSLLSMPYRKLGDPERARAASRRAIDASNRALRLKPDNARALYLSGGELIGEGELTEGLKRLERAVALQPREYAILYNAACGFARAGDKERALDLLDRAVGTGQGFRAWFENDPDLDSLRGLPRFQQILARLPPEPATR